MEVEKNVCKRRADEVSSAVELRRRSVCMRARDRTSLTVLEPQDISFV